ncbi:hypothetical protein AUR59_009900 [Stutzerimonas balearica]|uniref:AlgP family protein n=1 Tax=Stutzerimonas balearica TaxID=74829 RepID=UPI000774BF49|nr:AlgP family protein [Stutzerimonas balearica]MCZ4129474.1 AlgP family protein [Stutzerimonas balearica]OMG66643.1 hypothetical protein AUR59_009900 [Stutzerimonas balearica]
MPAKKKALNTPLQLLQELSNSLLVHFDKACRQAVAEAESALAKLEKQRGKAQDKLLKARARLDEAGSAGKSKAQAKARNRIEELESSMALLQERQGEMLTYLAELKRDVATATGLARGIQEVETAVGRAMQPAAAKADKAASPKATTTAAKRPAASAKAAASKPTSSARAPAKPAAAKRAPGKAAASSAANSKAAPASTAKPKPTPAKPASAKPAGTKAPAGSKVAASKAGGSTKAATAKKPSARKPARPASKIPEAAATGGAQPDASAS